jgi:hypothetical protein
MQQTALFFNVPMADNALSRRENAMACMIVAI